MRATDVSIDARVVEAWCVCSHACDVVLAPVTFWRRATQEHSWALRPACLLSHCCTCQSTDRQYLGQWAELYRLSIRPATSAYQKIHWHHCSVSMFPHQLAYINRILEHSHHSTSSSAHYDLSTPTWTKKSATCWTKYMPMCNDMNSNNVNIRNQ